MKALVMTEFRGPLSVETVPDPACPPDGAIVRLEACGVCRSDHHAWSGADPDVALPHVMGHEMAGVVEEVGPQVRGIRRGDRVTAPFILACGHCPDCRGGRATICADQAVIGFTIPGAFAQFIAVPRADFNLVPLPDSLAMTHSAGMGCRVTTAWRGLTERGGLRAGEWLSVHGCGGVGLSAVLIAAALGARVAAVDVNPEALRLARALGAEVTIDASAGAVPEAIRDATGGGAHVALDALGIRATFDDGLRALRRQGRYVQIGMPLGEDAIVPLPLLELIYARELSISGSRGIGAPGFADLLSLIDGGRLDVSALVTETISLAEVESRLRAMDDFAGCGVSVVTRFA